MMWYRLLFWASGWSGPYYHHRPFLLRNDHCLQLQLHFYCNAQFSEQDPHFNALELFLPWYVQVYIQEKKFLSRKGSFYSRKYVFFQQLQLFSDSELLWCNYTWYLVRLNLLKFYCPFCQILKFVLTFCNFFLLKKTKRSKKKSIKSLDHWVELFYSSSSSHLDLFPVLQIISNCLSQIKPWRAFC